MWRQSSPSKESFAVTLPSLVSTKRLFTEPVLNENTHKLIVFFVNIIYLNIQIIPGRTNIKILVVIDMECTQRAGRNV